MGRRKEVSDYVLDGGLRGRYFLRNPKIINGRYRGDYVYLVDDILMGGTAVYEERATNLGDPMITEMHTLLSNSLPYSRILHDVEATPRELAMAEKRLDALIAQNARKRHIRERVLLQETQETS